MTFVTHSRHTSIDAAESRQPAISGNIMRVADPCSAYRTLYFLCYPRQVTKRPASLFDFESSPSDASDSYKILFGSTRPPVRGLRDAIEGAYLRLAPHLDADFVKKFRTNTEDTVWELRVGSALLECRHCLKLPAKHGGGPDFTVERPTERVHIEAIRPELNESLQTQLDTMLSDDGIEFTPENIDEQVIRLTSAIHTKRTQHERHLEKRRVDPQDAFVIAIGDHRAGPLNDPLRLPILNALFALGSQVVEIDETAGAIVGSRILRQDVRSKQNGTKVNGFLFGGREPAREVSAIIYTDANLFSGDFRSFDDFVVIRNPAARTPLPSGFLLPGQEWALDGSDRISKRR